MLYGDDIVGGREQLTNDLSSLQPLFDIKVTRRLVEHVPVCER